MLRRIPPLSVSHPYGYTIHCRKRCACGKYRYSRDHKADIQQYKIKQFGEYHRHGIIGIKKTIHGQIIQQFAIYPDFFMELFAKNEKLTAISVKLQMYSNSTIIATTEGAYQPALDVALQAGSSPAALSVKVYDGHMAAS